MQTLVTERSDSRSALLLQSSQNAVGARLDRLRPVARVMFTRAV